MSELIEKTLTQAADSGKNTVRHSMNVDLKSQLIIEECLQTWGSTLGNSKAAPSWQRVTPYIEELHLAQADFDIVIDHEGAGALAFVYTSEQKEIFERFKTDLKELAEAAEGSDPAAIEKAVKAFDEKVASFTTETAFAIGDGPKATEDFLTKSERFMGEVTHTEFGTVMPRDIRAIGKVTAEKPDDPDAMPLTDDEKRQRNHHNATQAQSKAAAASGPPKNKGYSSFGQIVKANDAPELEKMIKATKDDRGWHKEDRESASKLLWHAARLGHVDCAKVLVKEGEADLEHIDGAGISPFLAAVMSNSPEAIDYFVDLGSDLKETALDNQNALMLAASYNAPESIRKLINDYKFDIDEVAFDGRTALYCAAVGVDDTSADKSIEALMDLGANPTIKNFMDDGLPEDYISEDFDQLFAALQQYRADYEKGATRPRTQSVVSNARNLLGF